MTTPDDHSVPGYCPMCGGQSLFRASGGHITCSRSDCPNPTAVDEILAERETEHIVQLGHDNFTVRHPLRERLNDELMDCELHTWISDLSGPPRKPGGYRVFWADRSQASHWEEIPA